MKRKIIDPFLAIALLAVVISGFSYTWTPVNSTSSSGMFSMSDDGRIICVCPSTAGKIRISRDWGQTWTIATNAPPGGSLSGNPIALSANGSSIIACLSSNVGNQIVVRSEDFGTNWTKLSLPSLSSFNGYCLACSANASNLIAAAASGPIYFSTNSGANWSTASAPSTNWVSLASSADGRRMVGAINVGNIYLSTNFGADWTPTDFPIQAWGSVCISADGKSIGATGANTYISRNGGAIWITNKISGNNIASSANGMTWMIAGAQIYTSSDGGVTWVTNLSNWSWTGTMSADGGEIIVEQTSGSGGLTNWIGHATPSPRLNIQTTNGNLGISWLLPSTNFVLQQNADIATSNWVTIPGDPTLNFTNLNQEISVPVTTSNAFFRLTTQ